MSESTFLPPIPGYETFEYRRGHSNRGGIAMFIRKGIKVIKTVGNEYAQGACI